MKGFPAHLGWLKTETSAHRLVERRTFHLLREHNKKKSPTGLRWSTAYFKKFGLMALNKLLDGFCHL